MSILFQLIRKNFHCNIFPVAQQNIPPFYKIQTKCNQTFFNGNEFPFFQLTLCVTAVNATILLAQNITKIALKKCIVFIFYFDVFF